MPREKNIRKLNFKPIIKSFVPENTQYNGIASLLHEEIEAIYLMDVLGLYQEDAAKSMEISRPTFTRILKNARHKLANGIIGGYKIVLEDDKKDCIVAFCSMSENLFKQIDLFQKYIFIYYINNTTTKLITKIDNPLFEKNLKPTLILPEILLENKVNIFISSKIGEGLKNTLLSKGIQSVITNHLELENLYKIIDIKKGR